MREEMIRRYSIQLIQGLGCIRPKVDPGKLRALHREKDFLGMVRYIRDSLNLEQLKIRVGIVKNGGPKNSPAWINHPSTMPPYGSSQFRETMVTMHIRKSFLEKGAFEAIVACMAHELSHVVLDSIGHELQKEEEAVDLAAMMLGYRDFFLNGRQSAEFRAHEDMVSDEVPFARILNKVLGFIFGGTITHQYGYLSQREVRFASRMMDASFSGPTT